MARARNLKPSFFKNEILSTLPPLARLLYQGLWVLADRDGRLEDRPARIKIEVLPYDNCDIEAHLNLLTANFIQRYEVNSIKYIQILNFKKHQSPHVKEPESMIPAPDSHHTGMVPNVPLPPSPNLNPESPSAPKQPVDNVDNFKGERKGDSKPSVFGKNGAGIVYNIERNLSDDGREKAKLLCKSLNRDIYPLFAEYDKGIKEGRRQPPNIPDVAFYQWIKAYTKEKRL